MKVKAAAVAVVLSLLFSSASLAQPGNAQTGGFQDDRLLSLDASVRRAIAPVLDSAWRSGLPTEPLMDLVFRARIKNIPANATVAAASAQLRRLSQARAALGAGAEVTDIVAGAEALQAGIDVATISQLRSKRKDEPLYVSLGVVTELVNANVPRDTAVATVLRMLAAGVRNADLVDFRKKVETDIALGVLPSAAASFRGEAAIQPTSGNPDLVIRSATPGTRVQNGRPPIPPV